MQRALALLPKQGSQKPWKLYQNYALDRASLKYGAVDDGTIIFASREAVIAKEAVPA